MHPITMGFALLLTALWPHSPGAAQPDHRHSPGKKDYAQLQEWEFAKDLIFIPLEGVRFSRDTATWVLDSGRVQLMRPLDDGRVTGFVFKGQGRFVMDVPDPIELAQLQRFAEKLDMEQFTSPFDQLVLRTSDGLVRDLFPEQPEAPFKDNSFANRAHKSWLRKTLFDVDARIIAATNNPMDDYLRVEFDTDEWDRLTYEYDAMQPEEVRLIRLVENYPEAWVSQDRIEDRASSRFVANVDPKDVLLEHIDVHVDLRKEVTAERYGRSWTHPIEAKFETAVRLNPLTSGATAVSLRLHPMAKVEDVFDQEGYELTLLRDHIGGRSLTLDNDLYDNTLVVLLDEPLTRGEPIELRFFYELEMVNAVPGNLWYPTPLHDTTEPHTGRLEIVSKKGNRTQAMGELLETKEEEVWTTVWSVDRPTHMITFVATRGFKEQAVSLDGVPEVVTIGPRLNWSGSKMLRSISEDVANSIQFFQDRFDSELDVDQLIVTGIVAPQGQSFDGFLHLPEESFLENRGGASELFRAHEVAHQWWGHSVRRQSYRDQWLSEAFSEYSAMMFVEATVHDGDALFNEMLRVYYDLVVGSFQSLFSRFARPVLTQMSRRDRDRLGPIGVGYRASTHRAPEGYFIQAYYKGALVLHMLRLLLREQSGSDELFMVTLRDFLRSYRGKVATTKDFQAHLEEKTSGDWSSFFDQWIYHNEIPTIQWSHTAADEPDKYGHYSSVFHFTRENTEIGLAIPVPVRVKQENGRSSDQILVLREVEETFPLRFESRVKSVSVNPDRSVLIKTRKD